MNFKEEVLFYLGKNKSYHGFNFYEEDESGEIEDVEGSEASCKTKKCKEDCASKKTEKACPECGKTEDKCKCKKSVQTGTKGGDDDEDGDHVSAAVKTEKKEDKSPKDFGQTPEELEMIKLIRGKTAKKGTIKESILNYAAF